MTCPDINTVIDFLDGNSSESANCGLEDHFDACEDCRALVAELGRTLKTSAKQSGNWKPASGGDVVMPGDVVGRYMIVSLLGKGAMGIVYKAYDPQLDRSIALKLLRVLSTSDETSEKARIRLLREAKAMAKLSDPNVVTIFDASGFGEYVYLAMELVDGVDLRQWLKDSPRTCEEIVRSFVGAGKGLTAAHSADIIHRDFKPSNILIDTNNVVRVADFGLATQDVERTRVVSDEGALSDSEQHLTATGSVMGTPAYMSPEVRDGHPATKRSDQYSFAQSLTEALSLKEIPSSTKAILERATQVDPNDRFPSMEVLVAGLSKTLKSRARRMLPFLGLVVATIIGLLVYWGIRRPQQPALCTGAETALSGIWDNQTKAKMKMGFLSTGLIQAEENYTLAERSLDSFFVDWGQSYTESCEATHVHKVQSNVVLDRRMLCLRGELDRAEAVLSLLLEPDESTVQKAAKIANFSNHLYYCDDVEALLNEEPMPPQPGIVTQVEGLTKTLRAIEAQIAIGNYKEGVVAIEALAQTTKALGYPKLHAEVLYNRGKIQWRRGDTNAAVESLFSAVGFAEEARSVHIKTRSLASLVAVVGVEDARYSEGLVIARLAEATLSANPNPTIFADVLNNRGAIFYSMNELKKAEADFRHAHSIQEKERGDSHHLVGQTLGNIALVLSDQEGKEEESLEHYAKGLTVLRAALGDNHPEIAVALSNRAALLSAMPGRQEQAVDDLTIALAIRQRRFGEKHPDVILNYRQLGNVEFERGAYPASLIHYQRAKELTLETQPKGHVDHARSSGGLGRTLVALGRMEEGAAEIEEAIKLWTHLELSGPNQSPVYFALAKALWSTDQIRSRRQANHAMALIGDDYPDETATIKEWVEAHQ